MTIDLHITVLTGFGEGGGTLDVAHETALVKAALLYADHVTLASPRVAMLVQLAPILTASDDQRAGIVEELASALAEPAAVARLAQLRHTKHPTVDERYTLRELNKMLRESGAELAARAEEMLSNAGVPELALAIQAGVLSVNALGLNEGLSADGMIERLVDLLKDVVGPGSTTFPLLDETTAGLVGALVREGRMIGPDVAHLSHPALATSWIGGMQTYPSADMSAVLDLRQELKDPLVRYRKAIIEVSEKFRFSPLDEEFNREASTAYMKNVTPELLHLQQLAQEKRVASILAHALAKGSLAKAVTAGVGFIAADAQAMPGVLGGAVGVGLEVASEVYLRRKDLIQQQRQNAYFYLFERMKAGR